MQGSAEQGRPTRSSACWLFVCLPVKRRLFGPLDAGRLVRRRHLAAGGHLRQQPLGHGRVVQAVKYLPIFFFNLHFLDCLFTLRIVSLDIIWLYWMCCLSDCSSVLVPHKRQCIRAGSPMLVLSPPCYHCTLHQPRSCFGRGDAQALHAAQSFNTPSPYVATIFNNQNTHTNPF